MAADAVSRVPVLWLCGPPGVGKTAVAWQLYSQFVTEGTDCAYVDIDQLGICYPEPPGDPGRHQLKAANLAGLVAGFAEAGATCIVVSGVVDAVHGVEIDERSRALLTVCRLRADPAQLIERLAGRRGVAGRAKDAVREGDILDATAFADVCVDTTRLSVGEVARQVRDQSRGWPGLTTATTRPAGGPTLNQPDRRRDGPILWLCGPTGVGKSTVGFRAYLNVLQRGIAAAYIDVDQIGFCSPAPDDHRLRARNLAAVWERDRSAGAEALVAVGSIRSTSQALIYQQSLPTALFAWCRLHAGREELTRRIMSRREGGSWAQPGDPLAGQSIGYLLQIAAEAGVEADLSAQDLGLRIDTDGVGVQQSADVILSRTGWPPTQW